MPNPSSEADARIIIDDLLRQVGWNPTDHTQVRTEVPLHVSSQLGETRGTYAAPPSGASRSLARADYVLYDGRGRPLAVIEAKKRGIHPYAAKQQTLPYAQELQAPFIFLTNGELIYFWDYQNDDARIVNSFFARRDLERLVTLRADRKPLATVPIPEHYLRQGESRTVRSYQRSAMQALDQAVELGKRRFLIELPTGTGKTDLTALYVGRLIQAKRAERILFLVDREQLAKQALETCQDLLGQYGSYWLKPGMEREEKQITVTLLQTMIGRYQELSSGYFDVVIADECHRSIYGAWQTALTHFDALHIGLTATPAAYIERNTFRFYRCNDDQPDFAFPIAEAFQKHYLVPYRFATGITTLIAEGAEVDAEHYDPAAFERTWTNDATNRTMVEEFDRLAWSNFKQLAPKQPLGPGKSIVFAITKHHAARLAEMLNQLHPEQRGNYAAVITSDVADADDLIRRFKYDDYPQVAVSVGMLDTGFDCREVLHLVMCRRVRSPILYQQMRGRGTRTAPHIAKRQFVIYDFFRNHKYFNDSATDIFVSSGGGHTESGGQPSSRERQALIELGLEDEWLEAVTYVEVGPQGEQVDKRSYVSVWETTIRREVLEDPLLRKVRDAEALSAEEELALTRRLNQPALYFNEENLRRAYREPGGTLVDFIRTALGTMQTQTEEAKRTALFNAWLVARNFSSEQALYLSLLKNRGLVRGGVDIRDLFQPPLVRLNVAGLGVELFGESGLRAIIAELNEAVFDLSA